MTLLPVYLMLRVQHYCVTILVRVSSACTSIYRLHRYSVFSELLPLGTLTHAV